MNNNIKVSVKRDHGMLKVDIGGRLYEPLSFKSFRRTLRMFLNFTMQACVFSASCPAVLSAHLVFRTLISVNRGSARIFMIFPPSTDKWICSLKTRRMLILLRCFSWIHVHGIWRRIRMFRIPLPIFHRSRTTRLGNALRRNI